MDKKPWEVHPALTQEKLYNIAQIIKKVRDGALDLYDPAEGDGPWSLGCRVYERTINALEKESETLSWLGHIRKNLYFVILINGIPVRFYKGDIENPNFRSLKRCYPEIEAQQCAFPYDESQWFWRLVIETDEMGGILRILMVQYTEKGTFQNHWEIPVMETVPVLDGSSPVRRSGIILESPSVSLKQKTNIEVFESE